MWRTLGLIAWCSLLMSGVWAAPQVLYVSPQGKDSWNGTLAAPNAGQTNGPFATLDRAREAARQLKAGGPVTVQVRGGLYSQAKPFTLTAEDSGTAEAPVTWQAFPGETPTLTGGRQVTGFTPHEGKVLKANVNAQGLAGVNFRQLLCNGRRLDLARYPNRDPQQPVTGGWAYADGKPVPMYQGIPDEPMNTLHYKESDARTWARPEEGEVMVFPRYNWWNNIIPIKAIDREQRVYTLAANASYGIRPGDRYWVQGLREELDAPGEWYLDKADGTLYLWPPEGANPATMIVLAPVTRTILELQDGTAHITFRGFTFECAEGTAIVLRNTTDCRIAACTIRNVGDYTGSGVSVSGGKRNGVIGCDIHDVGRDAINISGGNFQTLEPAEHYADNNYLHHTGIYYKQGVGVSCSGVGNRVSHNLIHDCPRFGLVWGGNDHLFEFNEIRHCNLETADCGAIYSWQVDWSRRGTVIRYNYLHDIIGFGWENGKWTSPHFNWGVYLDDGTCGVHVYGNIVARTIRGGVHVHGGRDNVIENNILVDGRDSQAQYSGYVKGYHPVPMITDTWNKFSGTAAYLKYPGYEPLTKSLEDAWQMAGNKFLRNIVSYREPRAQLWAHYNLPFDKTESDYNLIWSHGAPLRTGVQKIKQVGETNLAPNPGFEEGEAGQLPTGWKWGVRPNDSAAVLDREIKHAGQQSLRIEGRGTTTDTSGQRLVVNFNSNNLELKPGQTYQLSGWFRAETETSAAIMPMAYEAGKFFWAKGVSVKATPEWKRFEGTFRFPAPGDHDWREGMKQACIRIDISQGTGTVWVDEVELREAETLSEWEAWQALGLDTHSVIADPLFVDAAKDDYRLKPDSPAYKLGFKPIPVEKIGPYQDPLRATWPIKEAIGVRELVKYDWSKH
jgi:hypothetical protein